MKFIENRDNNLNWIEFENSIIKAQITRRSRYVKG